MGESVKHPDKSSVDATNRETQLNRIKPRWYNSVWNIFTEFSERSSVHGIRYLSERTLHWSERFWWLISLVTSICVCIYFIHQVWLKLNPVVITFHDQATPISKIPFPTITICSDNVYLPSVLNFSKHSEAMKNGEIVEDKIVQEMHSVSAFCGIINSDMHRYINRRNVQIDRNIFPHLKKVSPNLLKQCGYSAGKFDYLEKCNNGFSEILTDYGLCYTFNHLSSEKIYRAELLADDFPKVEPFHMSNRQNFNIQNASFVNRTYPLLQLRSGEGINFIIALPKSEKIPDEHCDKFRNKYRDSVILSIHSAEDVQQLSNRHYIIPKSQRAHLTVRPNIISTDEGLIKYYNKYQRKCIAENENELKFFRKYTQFNCHLEHFVNETLKACNCSHFWMPRENDTQICYGDQLNCSNHVEYEVIPNSNLTNKCLPACESISFDADIYFTKLDRSWSESDYKFRSLEVDHTIPTEISISFANDQYVGLKRSESYGKIDFVAGCGGILGLFMGCSFLSFIELIYFATLRVCCNLRKKQEPKNQLDPLNNGAGPLETQSISMVLENTIGASENGNEAIESVPNN